MSSLSIGTVHSVINDIKVAWSITAHCHCGLELQAALHTRMLNVDNDQEASSSAFANDFNAYLGVNFAANAVYVSSKYNFHTAQQDIPIASLIIHRYFAATQSGISTQDHHLSHTSDGGCRGGRSSSEAGIFVLRIYFNVVVHDSRVDGVNWLVDPLFGTSQARAKLHCFLSRSDLVATTRGSVAHGTEGGEEVPQCVCHDMDYPRELDCAADHCRPMFSGSILGQLVGIAPTLVAVRVGLGYSVDSNGESRAKPQPRARAAPQICLSEKTCAIGLEVLQGSIFEVLVVAIRRTNSDSEEEGPRLHYEQNRRLQGVAGAEHAGAELTRSVGIKGGLSRPSSTPEKSTTCPIMTHTVGAATGNVRSRAVFINSTRSWRKAHRKWMVGACELPDDGEALTELTTRMGPATQVFPSAVIEALWRAEHLDEEPDDGEMEGSSDDYED
ncbi:hypothetical protein DFH09DRAFT_1103414 [Mycena vulgaris]|nr:hypothetical protein DFH09DRAFT_1103414 [Mycena vulgaris]